MANHISHTITIVFHHVFHDETNPGRFVDSIEYRPAVLRVKPGDFVQWISNYNLKVCFHRGTPLRCIQVVATKPVSGDPPSENPTSEDAISVAEAVVTEVKKGYHYNVHGALKVDNELLIFGDPNCPEIIVE
jgi:hypothetical protein